MHAYVDGEFERMIDSEVKMACELGYQAETTEGDLKMVCVGNSNEAGNWEPNGECKSILQLFFHPY